MREKENQIESSKTIFEYIYIHIDKPRFIAFYSSLDTFPKHIYTISEKNIDCISHTDINLSNDPLYEDSCSWKQVRVNSLFSNNWLKEIKLQISENQEL